MLYPVPRVGRGDLIAMASLVGLLATSMAAALLF
jgi:hypothetical protein